MSTATNHETIELQKRLKSAGVRYALASYVDLHGANKAKMVPIDHLPQMLKGSELFTGAALDGVPQDVSDDEVAAVPDGEAAIICPWAPQIAWLPSTLHLNGQPFRSCSRHILQRVMAEAQTLGYTPQLGIEVEFYVFRDQPGAPVGVSDRDHLAKPCYDVPTLLDNMYWMDEVVSAMNSLGWDVYSFDHEDGISQFELDFNYADALTMSDRLSFLRLMLGEILRKHGLYATYMPKPFAERTGSGGHMNMSLSGTGGNLFAGKDDPRGCGLSQLGYQFISGVLSHADAACALIAPTVNSYKRLVKRGSMSGSTWAPIFACYGDNNRTNMLRIPGGGGRVECRAADSAINPYLSSAFLFAAGLEGIRAKADPGEPNHENMYHIAPEELSRRGIKHLPSTLAESLEALAKDPLSEMVLGKAMLNSFLDYKRNEWNSYHFHVSQWERDRYLRLFG